MAFVNEYISSEDREKYALDEIDKRFIVGGVMARDWTIDRDKNIYLRVLSRGREEFTYQSTWAFFWKGYVLILELDNISTDGVAGGDRHGHKRVRKIDIPPELEERRDEILDDLKSAFTAYKDGGVFATAKNYSLTLDVVGGK